MLVSEISWKQAWVRDIDATAGAQSFLGPWWMIGMAQGRPHDVAFRFEGGATRRLRLRSGDLQLIPAGVAHEVEWPDCRFSLTGLDPGLFAEAQSESVLAAVSGDPRLRLRDPLIEALVRALTAEAAIYHGAPTVWRALYRDQLARALVAQIVWGKPLLGGVEATPGRHRPGRERLRRVLDYIESHLDQPLGIPDIARQADLSPFHFVRVFRAAIGTTPARYVAERRVQRAVDLLAEARLSHAEIARQCGLGDAERLRRLLQRRLRFTLPASPD